MSQVISMITRQPIIQPVKQAIIQVDEPQPRRAIQSVGAQAIIDAISFPVEKREYTYEHNGQRIASGLKAAIVRTDTGLELGAMGKESYGLVPYSESIAPIIEVMDDLDFEFKGVLLHKGGRKVMVEAILPNHMVKINGDDCMPRMIMTNSYDGSTSIVIDMGFYRMVCMNGMIVPEFIGSNYRFKTTHTKDAGEKVKRFREAAQNYNWIKESQEAFGRLDKKITQAEAKEILQKIFTSQVTAKNPEAKDNKHVTTALYKAQFGQGQNGDLTTWSLYNGITETLRDNILKGKAEHAAQRFMTNTDKAAKAIDLLLKVS